MLKRIAAKDIRIGMFITELCGSWMEHPFFKTKFLLEDPHDLESLLKSGIKEVFKSLGLSENSVRLPLVNVDEDLANRLHNFTNKISKM